MRKAATKSAGGILRRLRGDRSGAGAIEFAFIAPVLIVLYIGATEFSVAMSVDKKLGRAASTVSDLLSRSVGMTKVPHKEEIEVDDLKEMVAVAKSIMAPYDTDSLKIKITGIRLNGAGKTKILWSWTPDGDKGKSVYKKNDPADIPDNLAVPKTFLIRTELEYRHDVITSFPVTGETLTSIDMDKTYHFRSRVAERIDCKGCPK